MHEETAARLRAHRDELSLVYAQALQDKAELEEELREINEVVERLGKAIEVLDPDAVKPQPKKRNSKVPPSEDSVQQVRAAITEHYGDGRDFTRKDLESVVNISHDTIRRSLLALRDRGEVRLTGVRGNPNGSGTPAKLYALMPEAVNA